MNHLWMKRLLSLILAMVMVVGLVPVSVFATEQEQVDEAAAIINDETATYTVEHHLQNADGGYDLKESDTLEGIVGEKTAAAAKTYEGYEVKAFEQITIEAEGTVVVISYDMKKEEPAPAAASYKVEHHLQNAAGGYDLKESDTLEGTVGELTAAEAKTYEGYEAKAFEQITIEAEGTVVVISYDMKKEEPAPATASYKVEHHLQNAEGGYDLKESDTLEGTVGELTAAAAKTYEGYEAKAFEQITIEAEGTVVVICYDMKEKAPATASYKVEHYLQNTDGGYDLKESDTLEGTVGELTAAEAKTYEGYEVKAFEQITIEAEGTVVAIYYDVALEAQNIVTYTVNHYKQRADGTYGSEPSESEEIDGNVGEWTEAVAKPYIGFTAQPFEQVIIAAENTKVDIYYQSAVVYNDGKFGYNGYYNVISRKDYVLVPGDEKDAAKEYEIVLNNNAGNRRQVIHVIEVDPSNPDVSIVPGYHQIDKLAEDPSNEAYWSHKELTEMAKYYEDNLGYNIVGGMNTDLYYSTYGPRVLVYNGESIGGFGKIEVAEKENEDGLLNPTSSILYVFKDATGKVTCDVKAFKQEEFNSYLTSGTLLHAVGVSFGMVVKNGELVSGTEKRGNDDAARSMVGVKEDGTLVICMNDGRGANNSVGFSSFEEGEAMLALGCKWAANCDGGGSSTFLTKREGEETFTMRSVPCDGAQRPTAHGIFVASNVAPTGVLNNVNIESDYDIFAPKTEYTFEAKAIDTHGYAMEMPADASWALSDNTFGTIENGKFVSNGTKGIVDVQILSGGKVVGSKSISVADPAVFKLSATSTVVPYSTPEKVRTIKLPIVAMTGEANVYVDSNAVSVALSNEAAGTLDGFNFTATDDTAIAGVNVTVTYGEIVLTYAIEFGKGSEVIFDFEDGNRAGFMGFEEAKKWSQNNGVNNTLVGSEPLAGQFNEYLSSETFIATTTNGGNVRNGNNALAWRLDNSDASFANWSYNVLFNTDETIVLRDVANGKKATTLGMWLYIPENAFCSAGKGPAFQSQLYVKNADGTYSCKQDHFMFASAATGKQTNLNSATNADIPESRWVYATIDISKYDYLCTPVATDVSNSRSPSFIRTYVKPETADVITFYIDDITLDYSSAVDDRVLPTITAPTYSNADTAISLENGASISGSNFAFSATVSDNAALDLTSGKIWVDGMTVKSAIAGGILSSKEDVILNPGQHTVAFEVKDELGNPAKLTRTFTVAGTAAVELSGHNDSGETPKAQSVYYVDINVADLSKVSKLEAKLKLHNANTWETKGAVVADGFTADFEYNEVSELLTVTVEGSSTAAGAGTIVSIPVRVWTFDRYNYVNNTYYAPADMGNKPVVNIICDVVYGTIDGESFSGSINVATELTTISSPYHLHDAELTVLNKEATTSEIGYENRTYCETCKSVIDWGTIIPKVVVTHNYAIVGDQFVCQDVDCGDVYKSGTGVFEMNGDLYYSINNVLKKGWQTADEGYCYAGSDYKLYVGEKKIYTTTYVFDENGVTKGAWNVNEKGTRYSYGPACYSRMWVELDGKTYYFGRDDYMYTGIRFVKDNPDVVPVWYDFGTDGATDKNVHPADGVYEVNGDYYVVKDGITQTGLHYVDGAYYLGGIGSGFERAGACAKNSTHTISSSNANGLLPAGTYSFGPDAKMIVKNGIYEESGKLYYYADGMRVKAGAVETDEGIYYFGMKYYALDDGKYYITEDMTNGLFPAGYYEIKDHKVQMKNGLYEEDGKLYYYENNEKQKAGAVKIDESIYYFSMKYYALEDGQYYITEDMTNGLFPAGYYTIKDHKVQMKNGLYEEDGKLYYYENNEKQKAGAVQIGENIYYFSMKYYALEDGQYYITEEMTNGLFPAGYYTIKDHKVQMKNGLYEEDGKLYYYENNVKQKAGAVKVDEDIYYFSMKYYAPEDGRYFITEDMANGLFPAGYYEIKDHKIQMKNGLVEEGGKLYYYVNNVKQKAGAVKIGDDIYYFSMRYYALEDGRYEITEEMTNGLFPAGYYEIKDYKIVLG